MIVIPVGLVIKQPDLGTAMMLLLGGAAVLFAAGVRLWMFAVVILGGLAVVPVAWEFLHDYQRRRIFPFLDPESDPLGSGYPFCNRRSRWARAGYSARGSCRVRKAT